MNYAMGNTNNSSHTTLKLHQEEGVVMTRKKNSTVQVEVKRTRRRATEPITMVTQTEYRRKLFNEAITKLCKSKGYNFPQVVHIAHNLIDRFNHSSTTVAFRLEEYLSQLPDTKEISSINTKPLQLDTDIMFFLMDKNGIPKTVLKGDMKISRDRTLYDWFFTDTYYKHLNWVKQLKSIKYGVK